MSTDSSISIIRADNFKYGVGSPEGVITAPVGSNYQDQTPGLGDFWVKQSGAGNTGWAQVGTGAAKVVRCASTGNLALNGLLVVDGVNTVAGDRVMVKNQAVGADNGIYAVAVAAWTRVLDFSTNANILPGAMVSVSEGAQQADSLWSLTTNTPIVIGVTTLTFQPAALPYYSENQARYTPRVTGDSTQNGLNLIAALAAANASTPNGAAKSAINRAVVLVMPGQYLVADNAFSLTTEFVDLVGVGNREDVMILGPGNVICQTADKVRIENLTAYCTDAATAITYTNADHSAYFPDTNKTNTQVINCKFMSITNAGPVGGAPSRIAIIYSGKYERCTSSSTGTANGLGFGYSGTHSGTFHDCTFDQLGFAGVLSGTFHRCSGSIGAGYGTNNCSGEFRDCTGTYYSFWGFGAPHTGRFYNCLLDNGNNALLSRISGAFLKDCTVRRCTGTGFTVQIDTTATRVINLHTDTFGDNSVLNGKYYNCVFENVVGGTVSQIKGELHGCRFAGRCDQIMPFDGCLIEGCHFAQGVVDLPVLQLYADCRLYNNTILISSGGASAPLIASYFADVGTFNGAAGGQFGAKNYWGPLLVTTLYWELTNPAGTTWQIDIFDNIAKGAGDLIGRGSFTTPIIGSSCVIKEQNTSGFYAVIVFATAAPVADTDVGNTIVFTGGPFNYSGAHNRSAGAVDATLTNIVVAPYDVVDAGIV